MKTKNREQLLNFINETSFAIDDIILYLDTHPCDEQALACYQNYRELREKAVREYTKCYGPLLVDNVDADNFWTWIESPWPWEGGCR